jgi:ABC-type Fe3+/spermidine/putrescine transport system ATPase subunit
MKVVHIDSVSKAYNGVKVLENVSLEIHERERIVILGPSGCGKTTILRLIAGFTAPDTGGIFLSGELVSRDGRIMTPPEQRRLGMVFQDLALWPHLSVKGNMEFGLKAGGLPKIERKRRIRETLTLVGMAGYADRRPAELSGGQQQRVALARALVLEPDVLLMDEPLSSLDPELNVRLRKEILGLQENLGFTMVHVTHDRDEAFDVATRVISMKQGRIEDVRVTSQKVKE